MENKVKEDLDMATLEELGFELRHVGINCNSEEEAGDVAG